MYVWEHPKLYGRKCHICTEKIYKMSNLELDHIIPYSQGGKKMNLAHRDCNRMKGSKSLKDVQKKMIFKTVSPKQKNSKNRTSKKKSNSSSGINFDNIYRI
ncbi:MAG: HNH endonuclease signature motif containing protein [Candidatus Woesearchaeota archaeon]